MDFVITETAGRGYYKIQTRSPISEQSPTSRCLFLFYYGKIVTQKVKENPFSYDEFEFCIKTGGGEKERPDQTVAALLGHC